MTQIIKQCKIKESERSRKIEYNQLFENDVVQLIYDKKISSIQIENIIKESKCNFGYGDMYTTIQDMLHKACKAHRELINKSAAYFTKKINSFYKINSKILNKSQQQQLKIYQTIVYVIYYHFQSISESNQLVCQIWNTYAILKADELKKKFGAKKPELKPSTLNFLTLQQLIPTSQYVNLSQFKQILLKLKTSSYITKKDHIEQLLQIYQPSQKIQDMIQKISNIKIINFISQFPSSKNRKQQKQELLEISSDTTDSTNLYISKNQQDDMENMRKNYGNDRNQKKKSKKKKKKSNLSDQEDETKKQNQYFYLQMKSIINKQCLEVIKFLEEITIDDEKRSNCKMKDNRTMDDWKKWAIKQDSNLDN